MLSSDSVQQAHDFALIAQAATLKSRVPFLHFFDGFRTSHEVNKIEMLNDEDLRAMVTEEMVSEVRRPRASPRTSRCCAARAQNPDVFFQAREACNSYYHRLPRDRPGGRWTPSPSSPAASTASSTTSAIPRPSG